MPLRQCQCGYEPEAEFSFYTNFRFFYSSRSKGNRTCFDIYLFYLFNIGLMYCFDLLQETYCRMSSGTRWIRFNADIQKIVFEPKFFDDFFFMWLSGHNIQNSHFPLDNFF